MYQTLLIIASLLALGVFILATARLFARLRRQRVQEQLERDLEEEEQELRWIWLNPEMLLAPWIVYHLRFRDLVFFVGAGISIDHPSNLPLASELLCQAMEGGPVVVLLGQQQ